MSNVLLVYGTVLSIYIIYLYYIIYIYIKYIKHDLFLSCVFHQGYYVIFQQFSALLSKLYWSLVEIAQWFLFGILVMDGMSERNHCHIISFSFHCFNGFSLASWQIIQHVRDRPLPYNWPVVTYGVLTACDRSVVLFNITDLITNCGGTVSL